MKWQGIAAVALGVVLAGIVVVVAVLSGSDDGPDGSGSADTAALVGPVWRWEELLSGDGSRLAPDDPSRYTIKFSDDGSVSVQADCNAGLGTYTEESGSIEIRLTGVTRALCAEGSLSESYLRQLGFVRTYLIVDGRLFLDLIADGGQLRHDQG